MEGPKDSLEAFLSCDLQPPTDFAEEMNMVVRDIYVACDPEQTNQVAVNKLIEFIQPYLLQDLVALENLRLMLDPRKENKRVSSEEFFKVMDEWTKKIGDGEGSLDQTPLNLEIDAKDLPYVQSTPRASYGQKLLNASGLLNLSQQSSIVDNQTIKELEEQVKKLDLQLNKVSTENSSLQNQLNLAEDQNEQLQRDLEQLNRKLHVEQQTIEQLQRDKKDYEETQEDLFSSRLKVEDLTKKLKLIEEDNKLLHNVVSQLENEKTTFKNKLELANRQTQEVKLRLNDLETELGLKEQEIASLILANATLGQSLQEEQDKIDYYVNETELLSHQKEGLQKLLHNSQRTYTTTANLSINSSEQGTPPLFRLASYNSQKLLRQLSNPISPSLGNSPKKSVNTPKSYQQFSSCLAEDSVDQSSLKSPDIIPVFVEGADKDKELLIQESSGEEDIFLDVFQSPLMQQDESLQAELLKVQNNNKTISHSLAVFEKEEEYFVLKDQVVELEERTQEYQNEIKTLQELNSVLSLEKENLLEKLSSCEVELNNYMIENEQLLEEKETYEGIKNERETLKLKKVQLENCLKEYELNQQKHVELIESLRESIKKDCETKKLLYKENQELNEQLLEDQKPLEELNQIKLLIKNNFDKINFVEVSEESLLDKINRFFKQFELPSKNLSFEKQRIKCEKLQVLLERSEEANTKITENLSRKLKELEGLNEELSILKWNFNGLQEKMKIDSLTFDLQVEELELFKNSCKEIALKINTKLFKWIELLHFPIKEELLEELSQLDKEEDTLTSLGKSFEIIEKTLNILSKTSKSSQSNCPASPDSPSVDMDKVIFSQESKIPAQTASPNLSQFLLEVQSLPEEEDKETIFSSLILQQQKDAEDTQNRMLLQQQRCLELFNESTNILKKTSYKLRDHKCIGAKDSIKSVFILLQELKSLLNDLKESSSQFGEIRFESRMIKCWDLVFNYTQFLKEELKTSSLLTKELLEEKKVKSVIVQRKYSVKKGKLLLGVSFIVVVFVLLFSERFSLVENLPLGTRPF